MARLGQGSALALVFLVLFCSATVVFSQCNTQSVDRTLEDGATGGDVVKATADKIRESGIFGDDHEFLRRMAKVESDNGRIMGPGGIWRVDLETFKDVDVFILLQQETPTLQSQFEEHFCFSWSVEVTSREYSAMDVPLYSALTVMVYLSLTGQIIPQNTEQQAELWTEHLNRNGDEQEFISISRSLRDADNECRIKGVDMVFVMDESGSVGASNFEKMKQLAIDITESFEIGPDRTQVAWISFASYARVVFNLTDYSTKDTLHDAIRGITYGGGGTAIGRALETLRTEGFVGGRNNFDTPEVAIVVTYGQTNAGIDTSTAADNLRRDRNVNVFAVGVGTGVDTAELAIIASAGIESTQDRTQLIDGFIDNQLNILQQLIRARTCFDAMFSDNLQSIERLNAANVSIPEGVTVHVAVECPLEGLTVNACGRTGTTILYFSRSSSPNSANYEIIFTIMAGQCRNTYIDCVPMRIFMTVEGIAETNEYNLTAMTGDISTLQGMC
ncbi:von Willebrand factor A domain-containing protein 2 [Geodia barretti]|uniref:von Willebrand factor A domain-containing protein 2 n=1 Tax=Geodia barretti TaxID=519541 RepID=A0AA35S0B9_GEOBA|nr:von Willebrand factor A domain-containing protein 2 [Geodia barretti]